MGLIILNEEQVKKLARTVYYQEVGAIHSIPFKSEPERAKYLRDCRSCVDSITNQFGKAAELNQTYEQDEDRSPIAHSIYHYVTYAANFAFQSLRNYSVRLMYTNKIGDHVETMKKVLASLDTTDTVEVAKLAKAAYAYEDFVLKYSQKFEYSVSRNFSKIIHSKQTTFRELVQKYQNELNYEGPFDELSDVQKIEVYDKIIEASGRGSVATTALKRALAYGGAAIFVVMAGLMVWDIYTAENKGETAVRDVAMVGSNIAVGFVADAAVGIAEGVLVGVEIDVVVEATALMVFGAVTGFVGGFIIGALAGMLIDWFFSSGGKGGSHGGGKPLSSTGGCGGSNLAPLPNGQVIARQIAHQCQN